MSEYPDLSEYGYQIKAQLGSNREGGRITWQGTEIKTEKTVVIKQFCFAKADSNWSGYKAYEQELNLLQQLDHPGIPKYLNGLETADGFCLIQEYIAAETLENYRQLNPEEIKQIARQILDVLIYLQQQEPPIIHRDLQPSNVLITSDFKVYLIDFGFASLSSKELSGSSVFKGTPGFIAPEQIIQPTLASDLYSLGITLICLLTKQKIAAVQNFASADNPYQLQLKSLLPELNTQARDWLSKMIHVNPSKRFANALAAKTALEAIDFNLSPSSSITQNNLNFSLLNNKPVMSGILALTGLSTVAVWGFHYVDSQPGTTVVKIAIAVVASMAIAVAELAAVIIAKIDPQSRLQGGILGIGLPILLVAASMLIWGLEEAVDICAVIIVAEIFLLSYFWWQLPSWQESSLASKIVSLTGAIAVGSLLGLKLIY